MSFLFGVLITAVIQVAEVLPFSNAVSFMPENEAQVTEYLNEIDNRMVPVVVINHFYQDATGKFYYHNGASLKQSLSSSSHFGRIVFMWDEPLMHGRAASQDKTEVINIMKQVKDDFPGVEFAHIEAYRELYTQYIENNGQLTLFYDADHIGFDCYGPFGGCGDATTPEIAQMVYLENIYNTIQAAGSDAKIFLVPGAFVHQDNFPTTADAISQLQQYEAAWRGAKTYVSGMGIFTWGDIAHITGARNNPELKDYVTNMLLSIKNGDVL